MVSFIVPRDSVGWPGGPYTLAALGWMPEVSAWLAVGPRRLLGAQLGRSAGSRFFSPRVSPRGWLGLSQCGGWDWGLLEGSAGASPASRRLAGLQGRRAC